MKKKTVQILLGLSMCLAVTAPLAVPAAAEEDLVEMETDADAETTITSETTASETTAETAAETTAETETESDFVEGSALLSDYGYAEGQLSDEGWRSEFLMMEYIPEDGVTMSAEDNDKLEEYYGRNGDDKKVANSEMVAKDGDGGYVQMSVEVNPNNESEEDILAAFKEAEGLDLAGKDKEMEIGGKTFLTVSGVIDKERYLLGVSTDQDDVVLALKVKYADTDARKLLTAGFAEIEEDEDAAEETYEEETESNADEAAEADAMYDDEVSEEAENTETDEEASEE